MKAFTKHPNSVGESYFQHMRVSFGFGGRMFVAAVGCFLHGIFPFLCVKTGSTAIHSLNHNLVENRDRRDAPCYPKD
ncbi:MAG: DUF6356 family protein [Hellea sp.]